MTSAEGVEHGAPRIPRELVHDYERLRDAATGTRDAVDLQGLGVLIRKGMAAWMAACAVVPTATQPNSPDARAPMLPRTQRDVVDVLAAMVLTIAPEVTA